MWGLRQLPSVPTRNRDAELPPIPLRRYYGLKLTTILFGYLTRWNERIHLIEGLRQLPLHLTRNRDTEYRIPTFRLYPHVGLYYYNGKDVSVTFK